MPSSDFGWFISGVLVGAILLGLILTYVEAKWQFISRGRAEGGQAE